MKIGLLPLYLALYDNHCQEAAAKARTFIDVIASELTARGFEVVKSPACRLLLDPGRTTQTQIAAGDAALPLTVETHLVRADLTGDAGTIQLHYTLLAHGSIAQTLRVTLELAAIE